MSHIRAHKYDTVIKISASYPDWDRQGRPKGYSGAVTDTACHSRGRKLKFLSELHTYVHLCVTNFQPPNNPPSVPFLLCIHSGHIVCSMCTLCAHCVRTMYKE